MFYFQTTFPSWWLTRMSSLKWLKKRRLTGKLKFRENFNLVSNVSPGVSRKERLKFGPQVHNWTNTRSPGWPGITHPCNWIIQWYQKSNSSISVLLFRRKSVATQTELIITHALKTPGHKGGNGSTHKDRKKYKNRGAKHRRQRQEKRKRDQAPHPAAPETKKRSSPVNRAAKHHKRET